MLNISVRTSVSCSAQSFSRLAAIDVLAVMP